jgi:bifunctional NMN adenylyltransferase/nudix hydrolase
MRSQPASASQRRYGLSVFIGRFSPPHLGHLHVIKQALAVAELVLIIIGSANAARSFHYVPYTAAEREMMIRLMLSADENLRVRFAYIEDQGNMPKWTAQVRKAVNNVEPDNSRIALVGHSKDRSSFYLKAFKGWRSVNVDNYANLSATDFREALFTSHNPFRLETTADFLKDGLHSEVLDWLTQSFSKTDTFARLVEERIDVEATRKKYGDGPFITADSIIIQGDHVLLVERDNHPYKGYYATPGGFVEHDERVIDAMLREKGEETSLKVPEIVMRKSLIRVDYYDAPKRDPRGRILTFAGLFYLNPIPPSNMTDIREIEKYLALPRVKAGDDAKKALWMPISDLRRDQMAFDCYTMIQNALDYIPSEI